MKSSIIKSTLGLLLLSSDFASAAKLPEISLQPRPGERLTFSAEWFGIHVHEPLKPGHWPDQPFGSWRLWDSNVTWSSLEPKPGEFEFRLLDQYVDKARQEKSEPLLVLGTTPRWASARPNEFSPYGPGQAAEPADLETWRRYVSTVAQRYKGRIRYYQIWNEANLKLFYTGSIEKLVSLTRIGYEEIKRVDPDALIVSPSGQGLDERFRWLGEFLAAGGAKYVDVLSYHLYHAHLPPEEIISYSLKLRSDLAVRGFDKLPIWNTETGYFIKPEKGGEAVDWSKQEASYSVESSEISARIPRMTILALALGYSRFYWYSWDNRKMGFIKIPSLEKNHSAMVLENTRKAFQGVELLGCQRGSEGLWECQLKLPTAKRGVAYWMDPKATEKSLDIRFPFTGGTVTLLSSSGVSIPASAVISIGREVTLAAED